MSKYRCPVCGATHKEEPEKCRLCGQYLGERATGPTVMAEVRQTTGRRGGVADIVLIAVGGVVLIALLFVVLGLTGSNSFIENIRDKIPGLATIKDDGWESIDDADGGFVAEMPETRERSSAQFGPSTTSRLERWVANIGQETELSVSYARLSTLPEGDDWRPFLESMAVTWGQTLGGKAEDIHDDVFRGYPGTTTTIDNLRMIDSQGVQQQATAKAWLVLRGDTLYIIQSMSVYRDHPNFSRLASSVQFTS